MLTNDVWLAILALGASIVNGAVGYGFSSTVTPVALLWFSPKLLNPALVVVEIGVNVALLLRERRFLHGTWGHAAPIVSTLLPGVVLGTLGLAYLQVNDVKLVVYVILFPLIALQLFGISWPVANRRRGGAAVGSAIGFLYALTTISGPPLALFLRNQGLSKDEFRAAIAQVRVAESSLTLAAYAVVSALPAPFGTPLLRLPVVGLLPYLLVPVAVGVPIGAWLLGAISPETFRRVVMTADALFVSYGLSVLLPKVHWTNATGSDAVLVALVALSLGLAYLSFRRTGNGLGSPRAAAAAPPPRPISGGPPDRPG